MIRNSRPVLVVFIGLSLAGHLMLTGWLTLSDSTKVSGGGSPEIPIIGNSFESIAQGVKHPLQAMPVAPISTENRLKPLSLTRELLPRRPTTNRSGAAQLPLVPINKVGPIPATETLSAEPVPKQFSATPLTEPLPPSGPSPALTNRLQGPDNLPETISATTVSSETETTPDQNTGPEQFPEQVGLLISARPKLRPQPRKQKQGAEQEQVRGSAVGHATGRTSQHSAKARATTNETGNSATSTYRGELYRCLNRSLRARGRANLKAKVRFRVAENGKIGSVTLIQKSGDDNFDHAARRAIGRAGPCPAPPPGANMSFTVTVHSR